VTDRNVAPERLLQAIQAGSTEAFAQFYERYAPLVYQIALRITGDQMEAEDLCHDIFVEVYRTAGQYQASRGSVEAWLAVKTRSRGLDRLRRRKRQVAIDPVQLPSKAAVVTPEEAVLHKLTRESVRDALIRLPEAQRQAVCGLYLESQTQQQLADRMGRPLGTIKSLIRYGLNNVRKQLVQLGWLGASGGADDRE